MEYGDHDETKLSAIAEEPRAVSFTPYRSSCRRWMDSLAPDNFSQPAEAAIELPAWLVEATKHFKFRFTADVVPSPECIPKTLLFGGCDMTDAMRRWLQRQALRKREYAETGVGVNHEGVPKYLRGSYVPLERALDIANREGITDLMYPLFVPSRNGIARPYIQSHFELISTKTIFSLSST